MYFVFVAPDEGRGYVLAALQAVNQHSSRYVRAKLHQALSRQAIQTLRYAEAYESSKNAIELARELGDDDLFCASTLKAIFAAVGMQRLDEAESLAIECIRIARARGHQLFERQARGLLPVVVAARGDYDRARSLFLELLASDNVRLERGAAYQTHAAADRGNFAENEFLAGRLNEAIRLSREAVVLAAEFGDLPSLRNARSVLCTFLCAASRFDEARSLALSAMEDVRQAGLAALVTFALGILAQVAEARDRIIESAAISAYVSRRIASEGFVRDPAIELQARTFAARLRERLDEAASKVATDLAAT